MILFTNIINDMKIQFRSGFYFAYLIICIFYIFIIKQIPNDYKNYATFLVIFTDPSVLGFYFIGGLLLLERRQNTITPSFVTPLKIRDYILSKVISLGIIAYFSSLLIIVILMGMSFDFIVFTFAVFMTSILFTLLGITLGIRAKDINRYLFISPYYLIVTILPVFGFFGIINKYIFIFIPTYSILNLMNYAILGQKISNIYLDFGILMIWIVIVYFWAKKWFEKFIIESTH